MARWTAPFCSGDDRQAGLLYLAAAYRDTTQYTRELMFSSLVQLMSEVVLGVHPTVHAAYTANSPPYTFLLLNGDMEFYRDRHLFI